MDSSDVLEVMTMLLETEEALVQQAFRGARRRFGCCIEDRATPSILDYPRDIGNAQDGLAIQLIKALRRVTPVSWPASSDSLEPATVVIRIFEKAPRCRLLISI